MTAKKKVFKTLSELLSETMLILLRFCAPNQIVRHFWSILSGGIPCTRSANVKEEKKLTPTIELVRAHMQAYESYQKS